MMPREHLVILGAGMASGRLLDHLWAEAPGAFRITLVNAEPRGSYNRIQLSPLLAGEAGPEALELRDRAFYARHGVDCRFGAEVTAIDRAARQLVLGQERIGYDRLVIATGSAPLRLPVPGADLPGVVMFRDLEDVTRMQAAAQPGARAVVIGGGLLGLEAAAALAARGMAVSVVHLAGHLMNRQLDPAAAALLQAELAGRGIKVICGAETAAVEGDRSATAVRLRDGRVLPADLVVMAAGIRPRTDLARAAGLAVRHGIVTDAAMRSSDPAILALGECAEVAGHCYGLVAPLYEMARVAAATLTGRAAEFVPMELATRLKVSGCALFSAGDFAPAEGREEILYRDPVRGAYKRLVLAEGRLIGAVLYGETADGGWYHDLIQSGAPLGALRDRLIFGRAFEEAA